MDESLTHLPDDISEISGRGSQPHVMQARGEHDAGTPFIRSSNTEVSGDPNEPFLQAQRVYRDDPDHHVSN